MATRKWPESLQTAVVGHREVNRELTALSVCELLAAVVTAKFREFGRFKEAKLPEICRRYRSCSEPLDAATAGVVRPVSLIVGRTVDAIFALGIRS